MLNRFMEASEKRHDATNATIRNQQVSIQDIKTQLGHLTKLVNEWLLAKNSNLKPQLHIMEISTKEDTIS